MNDGGDIIIIRNPQNKNRLFSSSGQQSTYNNTLEPNQENDANITETMKRKRQSEYAEELRQQILQKKALEDQANNPQRRGFMSNLGSLYGDQSIEIERKKRQQEKLAESLRKQIEEKRRAREIEKQKEAAREASYYSTSTLNSNERPYNQAPSSTHEQNFSSTINSNNNNNNDNSRYKHQTRKAHFQTQPISKKQYRLNSISQPPKPLDEIEDNKKSGFSKTAPFAPMPHLTFEIPTESPFSHSTVQTPPLGFSLRRDHPTSLSTTAPIHQNYQPLITVNNNFSKSSLAPHPTNNFYNNSNPNNSRKKYDHQINLNVKSDDISMRLATMSELVYPDGHISPIDSPR